MRDENPKETFALFLKELDTRGIGFVEVCNGNATNQIENVISYFRPNFKGGLFIGNEGFNKKSSNELIGAGMVHLVTFAKLNVNNPDLVNRFKNDFPLNT